MAILVLCAAAVPLGCQPSPATPPGEREVSYWVARDEELAAGAAVIFEGRVKSIRVVQDEHLPDGKGVILHVPADTIIILEPVVGWLVTVEVLKVRKDDAAAWSGEKRFAIHSPVRTFIDSADEAVGRTYIFYLRKRKVASEEGFSLDVTPVRS